eukprot:m.481470 g.481470  ORF g.481470 m.481470 type:complete len:406 (+) comp22178_c0_seq1:455-1672(+)
MSDGPPSGPSGTVFQPSELPAPEPKDVIVTQGPASPLHGKRSIPKLVVAMVGLPSVSCEFVTQKLSHYLNWVRIKCQVFVPEAPGQTMATLDNLLGWLQLDSGMIAMLKAPNTTREQRAAVEKRCQEKAVRVFFIEACMDVRECQQQSKSDQFESLDAALEEQLSFLKMYSAGTSFAVHGLSGYLQHRIVRYLTQLQASRQPIYITRHGESEFNLVKRIGGDPDLSERGRTYAKKLHAFMSAEVSSEIPVWCSTLRRTLQTAAHFDSFEVWPALDEINAGICDGMTYKEVKEHYPSIYADRENDKYNTRYPRGESYRDLVDRLEPRILELERQTESVLCICHQAVARCLLGYFRHGDVDQIPFMEVPLHTVLKVVPGPTGCTIESFPLGVDCVSTHRPKGAPADA